MENSIFERTIGLIGEDEFAKISSKTLLIMGLGGVGGTCFEALVRSGFRHFIIIDFDTVSPSNLNRQLLYTQRDINNLKVDSAKARALEINPDCSIVTINKKIDKDVLKELDYYPIDYAVDAIDDTEAKIEIVKYLADRKVPLVMSLGMANRIEPDKVFITKLNKTTSDPLAKKMRYELKNNGVDISNIDVAFSSETPLIRGAKLQSVIFAPSSAGLNIAAHIFKSLIKDTNNL